MSKTANLFLRGDVWYFRKKLKGSRQRPCVSTGCKDLNQAKRRKTELEKELNDDTFGWKKKVAAPPVVDWLQECVKVHGPARDRGFAATMALAQQFWMADETLPRRLSEVVSTHCTMFVNWLASEGYAGNTIRTRASYMKAMWNLAIGAGLVTKNPWQKLKLPKRKPRKRVLREREQPLFLAQLKPMWQRGAEFIILTGVRHFELDGLKDEDIDFVLRHVHVRAGKGGKERFIPLSPEAASIARAQITARDTGTMGVRLFPKTRRRIEQGFFWPATSAFIRDIQAAATSAELPETTVHDLRRTFGTRCAMSGVPMRKLQEWMGHSSIKTTAEFYVVADENRNTDVEMMAGLRASVTAAREEMQDKTTVVAKVATRR